MAEAWKTNTPAITLHQSLGFEIRAERNVPVSIRATPDQAAWPGRAGRVTRAGGPPGLLPGGPLCMARYRMVITIEPFPPAAADPPLLVAGAKVDPDGPVLPPAPPPVPWTPLPPPPNPPPPPPERS